MDDRTRFRRARGMTEPRTTLLLQRHSGGLRLLKSVHSRINTGVGVHTQTTQARLQGTARRQIKPAGQILPTRMAGCPGGGDWNQREI